MHNFKAHKVRNQDQHPTAGSQGHLERPVVRLRFLNEHGEPHQITMKSTLQMKPELIKQIMTACHGCLDVTGWTIQSIEAVTSEFSELGE